MRTTFACLCMSALLAAGCDCGSRLALVAPELKITQPTVRNAADWVIDFGTVQTHGTATARIVIENRGKGQASVTNVVLRDGSDPAFSLSGAETPALLKSSDSKSVTVTYSPTQAGATTGIVDIATDDPHLRTATVALVATAQASRVQVCVEPTPGAWDCGDVEAGGLVIDFGTFKVGDPTAARRVQVRNVGSLDLQYLGSALSAASPSQFALYPTQAVPAGGQTVAAGTNVQFAAQFTPDSSGNFLGTAVVTTNDADTPVVHIQLRASAAASLTCHLTAVPSLIDFGTVPNSSTSSQTMVVVNDGMLPCNLQGLPLAGSSTFSLTGAPTLPQALATNSVVTFGVRYAPSGTSTDTGTLTVVSDDPVNPSLVVQLRGASIDPPPCQLVTTPGSLNFGGLAPGGSSILSVSLASTGSELCTVTGAVIRNASPTFSAAGSYPMLLVPGGIMGNPSIGVKYAPTVAGQSSDTLDISYTAGFGGPTVKASVPLLGRAGQQQLCVFPHHLHFGAVAVGSTKDLSFSMQACGTAAVNVTSVTVEPAGAPFVLLPAPALPLSLAVTTTATQIVHLAPATAGAVSARVHVVSQDPVFPDQYVDLDTGPELVPPDAGEVIYSWTAGAFTGASMDGTVYRTHLQGPPNRTAFYGTQAGQSCSGCHAVSPDGRYVALIEYGSAGSMKVVDAKTGGAVPVPGTADGDSASWRPDVNTTPPYQFVFSNGKILKTASVSGGIIGPVQGADDPSKVQTHPSWGPDGQIAFTRGNPDADAGSFEITGPSDLMLVPESGGTAVPVAGASANGGGNYYPEFSPNGKYIAYTFSAAGQTSRSAPDSVIKLVAAANTGTVHSLPSLNAAGPNSWSTWSKDGMYLSFGSTRGGGQGSADLYYAPVNQNTGADGPAVNMAIVNTPNFDHIARWAMLPPP